MVLSNDRATVSRQQPDVQLIDTLVQSAVLEPGGGVQAFTVTEVTTSQSQPVLIQQTHAPCTQAQSPRELGGAGHLPMTLTAPGLVLRGSRVQ
jgi:hypothetical protein